MNEVDLSRAAWRKSTFSNNGGNCVEVASLADGSKAVRDSKDRRKAPHVYTPDEWDAFVKGVKAGEFD
jgi:hypothetical protein